MSRWLFPIALAALLAFDHTARADLAPLPFKPKRPEPAPPQPPNDPVTGKPMWDFHEEKPRRSGPFRSCGSGMGLGLAGIGATWGLFRVGTRLTGRGACRTKA